MNSATSTSAVPLIRLRLDVPTILLVAAIVLLGLIMVGSASVSLSTQESGNPFAYLTRQLVTALVGAVLCAAMLNVPLSFWQRYSVPMLIFAVVLLLAVLIPGIGHKAKGARRWLDLGPFAFQVSEATRVMVLLYLADYIVRQREALKQQAGPLLKGLGLLLVYAALLLAQKDFGAGAVVVVTGLGLLFVAGAQLRWVAVLMGLVGAGAGIVVWLTPWRLRRVISFMDPWADPLDGGFQLTQSLIAIGSGDWLGVGLGGSVQKLFYLPEAHTDFLFAVLAEELGLAGVALTLVLFTLLVWRVLRIARIAHEAGMDFHAYVAAGFGLWLGLQAFINIGVNMGVLPTKGLTLPLMSYGRSSLLMSLVWIGIVLRVYHEVTGDPRAAGVGARRRNTALAGSA
ncbi:MAG: putative lipid II flippase FtsW [Proteobacteria bacterium]|nr:putative lipid II flippase FtsW [Pseudomonadota bacterium]